MVGRSVLFVIMTGKGVVVWVCGKYLLITRMPLRQSQTCTSNQHHVAKTAQKQNVRVPGSRAASEMRTTYHVVDEGVVKC